MDVTEAKCLRALEQENTELKRLVGDLTLDNRMLKDILEKMMSLAARRCMAAYLEQTHGASERCAYRVLGMHRSTKRRQH